MNIFIKYGINGSRLAHFLAQIYQETAILKYVQELDGGSKYDNRADLGNINQGDGARFKERGLLQITGRINYEVYSRCRGKIGFNSYTLEPNNKLISESQYEAAQTAGLYWVSRSI